MPINPEERSNILKAVKKYGSALVNASEELKEDRGFMLEAMKQNGHALQYASAELKGDREIVLEAVKQAGPIILDDRYNLPEEVRKDLGLQVAALAALINEPKLAKASWVKEDVKSQLIDTQRKYYKGHIWKKMANKEIGLASVGNLAGFLTSREAARLEQTCSNKP